MPKTKRLPDERDFDLIEVALEAAAQSCMSGVMHRRRGERIDPLAAEYLRALDAVQSLRREMEKPDA